MLVLLLHGRSNTSCSRLADLVDTACAMTCNEELSTRTRQESASTVQGAMRTISQLPPTEQLLLPVSPAVGRRQARTASFSVS